MTDKRSDGGLLRGRGEEVFIPCRHILTFTDDDLGKFKSLEFLRQEFLRQEFLGFLPQEIYVRQEMIDVWAELSINSNNPQVKSQVLIGSPGVGKSVLCFLYALHLVATTGKNVMYWRKAVNEPFILVCIEKLPLTEGERSSKRRRIIEDDDDDETSAREEPTSEKDVGDKDTKQSSETAPATQKVEDKIAVEESLRIRVCGRFWRKDTISDLVLKLMPQAFPSLFDGFSDDSFSLRCHIAQLLEDKVVVMFADGPKHTDTEDTINGDIHFLCSSGGHPSPPNSAVDSKLILALCGWQKEPLKTCLQQLATEERVNSIWEGQLADQPSDAGELQSLEEKRDQVVELIYFFTGGRVRDALKMLLGEKSFEKFRGDTVRLIMEAGEDAVDLAINSTSGTQSATSFDRLRTYFAKKGDTVQHVQIVDSAYVLSKLVDHDMQTKFLDAYKHAVKLKDMTVAGHHFESMMHHVYTRLARDANPELPFDGAIQAEGTTRQSVHQIKKEKYWIPGVPNFPAIDAAVIKSDGCIVCVQYFAGKRHGFKDRIFKMNFLNQIPPSEGADREEVTIVFVVPSDQAGSPSIDEVDDLYESRVVVINVTSMETVKESALAAFNT